MRCPSLIATAAFVLFVLPALRGQKPQNPVAPSKTADIYAQEPFVIERFDDVVEMNADGTGFRERTVVAKVQSDAGLREFGVLGIPFASASEHAEFRYLRVRRPDGTVTETSPSEAIEQSEQVTREAPFYSDLKQEQLPVKNLRLGDTLEFQIHVTRTKPEAPGEFWGQEVFLTEGAVILSETLELRVPAGKSVTVWTDPTLGAKPKETTSGEQRIYRWEHAELKPTSGKEADAAKDAKKKHVLTKEEEADVDEGKLPSVMWTTFKDWAAVGAWYRGMEGDRMLPNAEVKAKVAEITAGKTSEEDKVRAVYAYVSTQVRYIGVAFGIGRYQPHRADDVLSNQYGDCKDKDMLLASMLMTLGLQPDAVLIGSGVRMNRGVPSPAAFNHLITRVKVNGHEVWLDSTAEVAPYRMLTLPLRDKEALVVPDSGLATLERTPADLPFPFFQKWSAVGTLNKEGISESHITVEMRGDSELIVRAVLRQISAAQYGDFMQRMLNSNGYGGTTSHPEFSRAEDTSSPMTFSFDYHREKGGDWEHYKIIPQVAPIGLPIVDEKEPPVQSIDLGAPRDEESHAEMKLPAGWAAEVPEAVHEKTAFASYDETYRVAKGTLYVDRRVVVFKRKVPASEWRSYKKWSSAINMDGDLYVTLMPNGAGESKGNASTSAGQANSAEAAQLIEQAISALQKFDDKQATALLDQAKKLNPNQALLMAAYGAVARMRGMMNEAVDDYRKELELHPGSYGTYGALAEALHAKGEKAEAEASLQRWVTVEPGNASALRLLIVAMVENGKSHEAVSTAKAALAKMPEEQANDSRLQFALGRAEMAADYPREGGVTLVALLKNTDDLTLINSAAYLLAEANIEPEATEIAERAVIEKLSKETEGWTLDESPATLKKQTTLLIECWDTLGWILFHEHKFQEAESFTLASWFNGHHAVVGSHVSEIRSKLQDASPDGYKPVDVGLGKSSQDRRTIALGDADGREGAAEYRLLLSEDRIVRAEASGEKSVSRGKELLESTKLPQYFPEGSHAKLARNGMLNCYSGKCALVFVP